MESKLYNMKESARILGVGTTTLRYWMDQGFVKTVNIGNSRYLDQDSLDSLKLTAQECEESMLRLQYYKDECDKERISLEKDRYHRNIFRKYESLAVSDKVVSSILYGMLSSLKEAGDIDNREEDVLQRVLSGMSIKEISSLMDYTTTTILYIVRRAMIKTKKAESLGAYIGLYNQEKLENETLKKTVEQMDKEIVRLRELLHSKDKEDNPDASVENKNKELLSDDAAVMENERLWREINTKITPDMLSCRAYNVLAGKECKTLGDIVRFKKADYIYTGSKTVREIRIFVESHGLEFGTDVDEINRLHALYLIQRDGISTEEIPVSKMEYTAEDIEKFYQNEKVRELLMRPIASFEEMPDSTRIVNALLNRWPHRSRKTGWNHGSIKTMGELVRLGNPGLLRKLPNMGSKSIDELKQLVASKNLYWGYDVDGVEEIHNQYLELLYGPQSIIEKEQKENEIPHSKKDSRAL